MKRIHVIINGNVQKVGFRYSVYWIARLNDIKGWVRNLDDDKVEGVFEGEDDKLDKILEFCKKGPFLANVKDVKVKEQEFKCEKSFKILR